MKKAFLLTAILTLLVFISCSEYELVDEVGYLQVSLPPADSRSLSNSQASSLANRYALIIWNSNGQVITVDSSQYGGELPIVALPANTYKVIALAGYGANLVGVGYESAVTILAQETTQSTITLAAPQVSVTMPTEVYESDIVDAIFSFNIGSIPLSISAGFYYIFNPDNTTHTFEGRGYPLSYSHGNEKTISVPMPLHAGTYYFWTDLSSLAIVDDCFENYYHSVNPGGSIWSITNIQDVEGLDAYNSNFYKEITVSERPTGLDLTLIWEQD